jgi:integrase
MINQGAHPEAIKRHLGHSSITVTMDRYGHRFPSEADALAERLNRVYAEPLADKSRTSPQANGDE